MLSFYVINNINKKVLKNIMIDFINKLNNLLTSYHINLKKQKPWQRKQQKKQQKKQLKKL